MIHNRGYGVAYIAMVTSVAIGALEGKDGDRENTVWLHRPSVVGSQRRGGMGIGVESGAT